MSFNTFKSTIEEGDTVILYLGFNTMYAIPVHSIKTTRNGDQIENVIQTNYGAFKAKDLIGQKFGTKIAMTRGYGYALYPTPELWTKTLPHRTQIIYATDISLILMQLELKPGSVVIESGTGSGSLSHSFIRTIAPSGHLHTFDFHQQRVQLAQEEFEAHGVGHLVTAKLADACVDGFGLVDVADAVFLDLPHPWEAVHHAKVSLKKSGGRICSFSPCIEQVSKTASKMKEEGFIEITTMECLLRELQVRRVTQNVFDHCRQPSKNGPPGSAQKAADDTTMEEEEGGLDLDQQEPEGDQSTAKKAKMEDGKESNGTKPSTDDLTSKSSDATSKSFVTAIPLLKMPGHTGFLTFATLPPVLSSTS